MPRKSTGKFLICRCCGDEYYVQKHYIAKSKFCSMVCVIKGRRKPKRKPRVRKNCKHCGKLFFVTVGYALKAKYCSQRCVALSLTPEQREPARRAATIHGMRNTLTWKRWYKMIQRCRPPNGNYVKYGIVVCEAWEDFRQFYSYMGSCPSEGHTIDRYPNAKGNYEPGNVRWATWKEQGWSKIGKRAAGSTRLKMSLKQRGENNATAKITDADVREIRAQEGHKTKHETAAQFGIATSTVRYIQRRQSWRHVV